ncbi:hypothetical protein EON64_08030, partial [archaeon]
MNHKPYHAPQSTCTYTVQHTLLRTIQSYIIHTGSRRFSAAKEREALLAEYVAKFGELPRESSFDSNCITPGTEFMDRLGTAYAVYGTLCIGQNAWYVACMVCGVWVWSMEHGDECQSYVYKYTIFYYTVPLI